MRFLSTVLALVLFSSGFLSAAPVRLTILQLNDVYEIAPIAGGTEGGVARVATLRETLLAENPNLLTVIAGDFFSPSALATAKVDGERLDGRQMVAVMNALPLDLATFGNHEFDLEADAFFARLAEAEFPWVASNLHTADGQPFPGAADTRLFTFENDAGESATFGFFGLMLEGYDKPYLRLGSPTAAADRVIPLLRAEADVVIGLTHQSKEADIALAQDHRGITLIMGGHEHDNMYFQRGPDRTLITKADANARTVWVHRLTHDPATADTTIHSELVTLDATVPLHPGMAATVEAWTERAFAGFRAEGFEPLRAVARLTTPLDGREASVRNHPTPLSRLIADAYRRAIPEAELAFFNTGSIRIDDVLPPGPLTEYDVIRVHPFGGHVVSVRIAGNVLARVLDVGLTNRGSGGFLATSEVTRLDDTWFIGGKALDPYTIYTAALNNFLLTGLETRLDFLAPEAGQIQVLANGPDVRTAVIAELARLYPIE